MSRRKTHLLVPLLLVLSAAAVSEITGTWIGIIRSPEMGDQPIVIEVVADSDTLTGDVITQFGKSEIRGGKVVGDTLSFYTDIVFNDTPYRLDHRGVVDGNKIAFTRKVGDYTVDMFFVRRVAER